MQRTEVRTINRQKRVDSGPSNQLTSAQAHLKQVWDNEIINDDSACLVAHFPITGSNRVLPFVDLASLMFLLAMVTPFCKRNMFRMFISGTLIVSCILYVGTDISKEYTQAAVNSNIPVPEGMSEITNIVGGATTPVGWLAVKFGEFFSTAP